MSARQLRALMMIGGGCTLAALLAVALVPSAVGGWLAAFAFWSGVPFGALLLVMMMRLIPGAWSSELGVIAERALLLLPLAAIAVIPVLAAAGSLYPWSQAPVEGGFRGAYLALGFFASRTLAFFAITIALAALLLRRPRWSTPVSSVGLIVFVLAYTVIATDWLMSLEPDFHSSGFALYVLSLQACTGLATLLLVRLAGMERVNTGLFGALLLTALMLWAYLAFMQYFIIWSDNLPHQVLWYQRRDEGVWAVAEYAIGVLGLAPMLMLLFAPVRRSRSLLMALAICVLLGKAIETSWLVLPATHVDAASLAVLALGHVGLGALSCAGLARAPRFVTASCSGPEVHS